MNERVAQIVARSSGVLTITALLLFALLIALTTAYRTREEIARSFDEQRALQHAQLSLEDMLKWQLNEENYLRAYVITHDSSYLDAYSGVSRRFAESEQAVRTVIADEHLATAASELYDYDHAHADWHREVADPLLRHPSAAPRELEKRGKFLLDMQTEAAGAIEAELKARSDQVREATEARVSDTFVSRALWLIVFGVLAIALNVIRSRVRKALDEEKMTTQTLQRAFVSEHVPLPNCEVGSAYGSASSHLAVGGDIFDIYQLSDRLALLLIADVSGKGVNAAVLTAFIKFTIRGIALRRRDPGYILQEFNTAFPRTVNDPGLFVSMFVGLLDTQTLRLEYASAGHEPAFLRRSTGVEALNVTGPVLGVMEEPFDVRTVYLDDGDTLLLATDGLTEARDRQGRFLDADGAMLLIERLGDVHPQTLADRLIEQIRLRGGNRLRDDTAILAIRVHEPAEAAGA